MVTRGRLRRAPAVALLALMVSAASLGGCLGRAADVPTAADPGTVTICGTVRSVTVDAGVRIEIEDARSGVRFVVTAPLAMRGAVEARLGASVGASLAGRSICATGIVRGAGGGTLEVSDPAAFRAP